MDTTASDAERNILDSLRYAAVSDVGLRREENQDAFGVIERPCFKAFIVADGMGGAQGGATASRLAVDTLTGILNERDEIDAEAFVTAVYQCNSRIFERAAESADLLGMGTTFVALLFKDTSLYIVHVGDSRAYRIRSGKVKLLTEDHTLVKELVKSGAISVEQAENHPISHMLTRSLGPSEETLVDCAVSPDGPVQGDVYLLCSDGLYNHVNEDEYASLLSGVPLEEATGRLVALANERGGTDNITVMLVEIGEEYPVTLEDITVAGLEEDVESGNFSVQQSEGSDQRGEASSDAAEEGPSAGARIRGGISQDEQARRIDLLIEETSEIIARQKQQEKERHVRQVLFFLLLCIIAWGAYLGRQSLQPAVQQGDSQVASEPAAASVIPPEKEAAAGYVSSYRPRSAATSRLSRLQLQPPSVTTLWFDAGASETEGNAVGEVSAASYSTPAAGGGPLLEAEKRHIRERKAVLRQQMERLQGKLDRFDQPITAEFGSLLRESAARVEALTKTGADLRAELDAATRKLSVWFDRKKRLEVGDPINMASEVAVSSEPVRMKKEAFEKVTWDYLKELENLRFNQNNAEQERKVAELLGGRNMAVNALTTEVKRAIDENMAAADQEISELTQRRDAVEAEIAGISREVNFIKSVMNASPEERERLKAGIVKEKAAAETELQELIRVFPDEPEEGEGRQ